jgi:glycosyltransferase involved in cell wall biosynthesis
MQVTQVIAGLAQADGGPSYSVPALSGALSELGVAVRLRSVVGAQDNPTVPGPGFTATAHPADAGIARLLKGSRALRTALEHDAHDGALLHAHGVWLLPNLYPAWIKRRRPATLLVHSPRGMLAPAALQISRLKKKPVWHLWQQSALQSADCLHATAMSEYEEIRALGLARPVAVIPNGIHLPVLPGLRSHVVEGQCPKTILSLGRLHTKKALDALVRAWATLEPRYPEWCVRIVGPSEGGYDEELRRLAHALGVVRISIEGPVYGEEKLAAYRSADLFVLPTRNENFGIAVAEALAAEVPVVSTKGAPWSGLEREQCGWWIDHGVEPLANSLAIAMDTDACARAAMGRRGRLWMERDFGWQRVATDMRAVYAWLRHEGPMPSCVHEG